MRWHGWWQVLIIVVCAVLIPLLAGGPAAFLTVVLVVPAYVVGRRGASMQPAVLGFGIGLIAQLLIAFLGDATGYLSDWLTSVFTDFLVVLLPWWIGRSLQLREIRRRDEDAIIADLARVRERARIAEDMHDLIGHDLALIALHSGALEVLADASEEQRTAAAQIRTRAVAATDRLHEILGVLRADDTEPRRSPSGPDLDRIVAEARESGMPVSLDRSGDIRAEAVSRAVDRVVTEAVTNAAKHAPGAQVRIMVKAGDEAVDLEVVNDRRQEGAGSPTTAGAGMGLIAAEERVRLLGGSLSAREHRGGFRVRARIPQSPSRDSVGPHGESAHDESGHRGAHGGAGHGGARHGESAYRGAHGGAGHGRGELVPDVGERSDPVARDRLRRVRRRSAAGLRRAAIVPIVCAVALLGVLAAIQIRTFTSVGLPEQRFDQIRVGQAATEAKALLPDSHIDAKGVSPTITLPPVPDGSTCEYYPARNSVLDFGPDFFRICVSDGVVVAADRLSPRRG